MTAGRNVNSLSQDWGTPPKYVDAITKVLKTIHLDPCSNDNSIVKAIVEYKLPTDGLKESWEYPTIYVNPPYGKDYERNTSIKHWLKKCWESYKLYNSEVIALIPVATNTSHWKEYIWDKAKSICFLYDTRLKFLVNGKLEGKGAPMSCCCVYWGDGNTFREVFTEFGAVVDLYLINL